jgi:predicted transcriptional regulator
VVFDYPYIMAKIKLDTSLVNIQRRRMNLRPSHLAAKMGITRQLYHDMMVRASISHVDKLAEIFEIDKRALIIIE